MRNFTANTPFEIYKITCLITHKVYIGITSRGTRHRFRQHLHSARVFKQAKLYVAIREYGQINFSVEVLCICIGQEEAYAKEKEFIAQHDSFYNGYNSTTGGGGVTLYERKSSAVEGLHKICFEFNLEQHRVSIKDIKPETREQKHIRWQKQLNKFK